MLSSTAEHLYWMGRSLERAENTARMLDITYRMSLTQHTDAGTHPTSAHTEWAAVLSIIELDEMFRARGEPTEALPVVRFMTLERDNPSSILNSLRNARENAHAVRGTMASEMWESLNHTWLEIQAMNAQSLSDEGGAMQFCDWVKERTHLFRGIMHGAMLRDDAFRFLRLGTFLERADNTARILDVKYHSLLPERGNGSDAADYYQWSALLRSVSAFESFRKVYKDLITPRRVVEMLALQQDMPRSLAACVREVNRMTRELDGEHAAELARQCGLLQASLAFGTVEEIFAQGLHEFLTEFLVKISRIGEQINAAFFWRGQD